MTPPVWQLSRGGGVAVSWPPPVQPTPEVIARAVQEFYVRVLRDPSLAAWFDGVDVSALRAHQTEFLLSALAGAPGQATRPDRMRRRLERAHRGLGIDGSAFERALGHLEDALRHIGMTGCQLDGALDLVRGLRPHVVDEHSWTARDEARCLPRDRAEMS